MSTHGSQDAGQDPGVLRGHTLCFLGGNGIAESEVRVSAAVHDDASALVHGDGEEGTRAASNGAEFAFENTDRQAVGACEEDTIPGSKGFRGGIDDRFRLGFDGVGRSLGRER